MPLIRAARPTDIPAIATLWNAAIETTTITFTTEQKTDAALAAAMKDQPFLVAELDGDFAGFSPFGPFRDGPGYAHVAEHSIFVVDRYHGIGLAATLLMATEAAARDLGKQILIAGISSENTTAQRFHARRGYVETARMPEVGHKFGRYLDLVLMQKRL